MFKPNPRDRHFVGKDVVYSNLLSYLNNPKCFDSNDFFLDNPTLECLISAINETAEDVTDGGKLALLGFAEEDILLRRMSLLKRDVEIPQNILREFPNLDLKKLYQAALKTDAEVKNIVALDFFRTTYSDDVARKPAVLIPAQEFKTFLLVSSNRDTDLECRNALSTEKYDFIIQQMPILGSVNNHHLTRLYRVLKRSSQQPNY